MKIEENPFKAEHRFFPVEFGNTSEQIFTYSINIPSGYAVIDMPPNESWATPDKSATAFFNFTLNGNKIFVTGKIAINKHLFQPDEYKGLRDFFEKIVSKQSEMVTLSRAH